MTTRTTIAQTLNVVKSLDVAPAEQPPTIAVLHLGHPSGAEYGTVEHMTVEQYEKFVWLHTWPRPSSPA